MKVFWFDVETTGLNPRDHGIVQLGCIIEINGVIKEEHEFLINPLPWKPDISPDAMEIHGYTEERIRRFPGYPEIKNRLQRLLKQYVNPYNRNDKFWIGGYNVHFDIEFLDEMWRCCGDKYFGSFFHRGKVIDPYLMITTLRFCNILSALPDYRLSTVADELDISHGRAHDAMADIRVTREIVLKIRERMAA